AQKVNDVYEHLTGERPTFADPDQAGQHLGGLLDQRVNVLLVIDDVWTSQELRPFLHGGATGCTRLVTTRRPAILPPAARDAAARVDELTAAQARSMLAAGLPQLDGRDLGELVALTGRWPLLVQLARRHLATDLRGGLSTTEALARLVARLRHEGPTV